MKSHKRLLIVLVSVFLLVAAGAAFTAPKVDFGWSPDPLVTESIAPGETATYAVVLKNLGKSSVAPTGQLQVIVEGDIAPYIAIEQPAFPKGTFQNGDEIAFDVTVSVPANAPIGVYEGELLMTRVLPNGKVKDVWRADGLFVELTFSPIPLPPDPGEEGKATIAGIDSDGDGVRDDVQRWIVFTSPDSEKKRAALTQNALALQEALLNADDKEKSIQIAQNDNSSTCLRYIANDEASRLIPQLEAEVANTYERSRAYIAHNNFLGGEIFHGIKMDEWNTTCDFDIDSMED